MLRLAGRLGGRHQRWAKHAAAGRLGARQLPAVSCQLPSRQKSRSAVLPPALLPPPGQGRQPARSPKQPTASSSSWHSAEEPTPAHHSLICELFLLTMQKRHTIILRAITAHRRSFLLTPLPPLSEGMAAYQKSHFSGSSTCGAAAIWRATCSSDTCAGFMPPRAPPAMGYSAATACLAYELLVFWSSLHMCCIQALHYKPQLKCEM